ncbi:syntaxin-5 isoform X1 [Toxorhynchites rutilus septentrionalis]|uniref:syntaxin-5 isoform X1 n=2 Tax=Toxorhynchites rutilus septentrionalis TaxID=329112 RepID=UPI0024787FB9|nr:syntaxin-5 isoform X1 [Toxorhynchites rutilus septentrionalis]
MQSKARRRFGPEENDEHFSVVTIGNSAGDNYQKKEDYKEKPKYPEATGSSWFPKIPQKFLSSVISSNTIGIDSFDLQKQPPTVSKIFTEDEDKENEPEFIMTARDRSTEFANAIRSLQGRNIQRAVNLRDPRKAKQLQSYSEFMMIAKHIGKNVASTYAKLEKLTLLAKRKTLFDDRPAEIQELTYIIKGDLNSLNQQIARLQEVSKSQRKSNTGKHLLSHSSNMVVALQAKLANMSSDFKQVLEVRTENLKQQKNRRDQFSQGPISSSLPPSAMRGSTQGSLLLQEQDQVSIDMNMTVGSNSERVPLLQQQQQQQQQLVLYDESDNYVQERAETMQNIESTIVELGGIFQQLAHMVKEQEEMVERIDTNLQDVEMNVEAAHGEILKYFQSVTKNRWLMIKIFGILILFFIFFVIFLA